MKITTQNIFDLDKTIAKDYLSKFKIPWQALYGIKDYIIALGKALPQDRYDEISEKLHLPMGTVKTQIHRARERMCNLILEGEKDK